MDAAKKADMLTLFPKNKNLDFVCGWYKKANDLIQGTATRCAFVSTNSITQGEQVAALWKNLNAEIDFAYRTFRWHNEAKGNAAVHCVIIGFHAKEEKQTDLLTPNGVRDPERVSGVSREQIRLLKTIYDSDGTAIPATHINGYLMDAPDIIVESRNKSLCDVPQMVYGNKPTDGGNLILTPDEKDALLSAEPQAAQFIRPLLGAEEYIHGKTRYCIWLVDADVALLNKCPLVKARIEAVRQFRSASKKAATRKKADYPTLFDEVRQPKNGNFIAEPQTDFIFASLDTLFRKRLSTGSRVVELLDEIEYSLHRHHVRVGAVVGAPFLVDGTGAEDTWEEFVGDADGRVGLAVFQQDIITWVVLLDERVLQQKCIFFCIHNGVTYVVNLADEYLGLKTIHLCVEVRRYSCLEVLRLPHIDDGLAIVIELVTTRLVR